MKLFLKPKEGLKVPRPENGRELKAEGELVESSTYWRRRIIDGDVTEVSDKSEASQPEVSESKSGGKKGGSK